MWLKSSTNGKRIHLFHIWTRFVFFLVQVRMCLVVIGGEISSKKEMAFLFRNCDSSFWQSNVYRHHQTTKLSVTGP